MTSYINLINNFWLLSEEHDFRPIDISLYFYLLKIANSLSWKPSFRRNNMEIMAKLGISSRHTLNDARNKLKIAGLIDYKSYNGKPFSTYSIIDTCAKNTQVDAQVDAQVDTQVDTQLNKNKNKIKKENTKRKKAKADELPLKLSDDKKPTLKQEEPPPNIDEVVAICQGKGMTEQEAKDFFYYYDAQGWVTSSGQKIKRVDSMVNRWLTTGKQKQKTNGNKDDTTRAQERNDSVKAEVLSHYL